MKDNSKSFIETAAEVAESVLPEVQSVLASAFKTAHSAVESDPSDEAPATSDDAALADSGGRGSRLLTALVIGGLMAVAAIVIQRILSGRGSDSGDNWTSAYTPAAPEADTPTEPEEAADETADEPTDETAEKSAEPEEGSA